MLETGQSSKQIIILFQLFVKFSRFFFKLRNSAFSFHYYKLTFLQTNGPMLRHEAYSKDYFSAFRRRPSVILVSSLRACSCLKFLIFLTNRHAELQDLACAFFLGVFSAKVKCRVFQNPCSISCYNVDGPVGQGKWDTLYILNICTLSSS